MLEPSTPEERLGCLGSILGMLLGGWLGLQHFDAHARQHAIDNPDAGVDGLQVLAAIGLGAFCGLFAGALVGMLTSRLLPGQKHPADHPKPGSGKDL